MAHDGWVEEPKLPESNDIVLRVKYATDLEVGYYTGDDWTSIKKIQCKCSTFWKEIKGPIQDEFHKMGT